MTRDATVLDLSRRLNNALREQGAEPPVPGVYNGVSFPEYHAWSVASNSRLNVLRRSAAHLRAYLDEPTDTPALIQGRAIHCAVLEPDSFASRYARFEGDARTKADKELREHLTAKFGDGFVLKADEFDMCLKARDAIHAHHRASKLLSGDGQNELSLVWDDPETGVRCKARHDRHSPWLVGGAVVDVKTTRDASPREFEKSIYSYGYHRQGALYLSGATTLGLPAGHFVIIAVEKTPPFCVSVCRVSEGALNAGAEQITPLLRRYAECVEKNEWPGYSEDIVDVTLPDYAWTVIDQELSAHDHQ